MKQNSLNKENISKPRITIPSEKELINQNFCYMLIEFGYLQKYIVDFEIGIGILSLFKNAEMLNDGMIQSITEDNSCNFKLLSKNEYLKLKTKGVINRKV